MKKLNRTHKTKDEKRRLLLTRKYAMSQKRIQKHGSDSVGAIAVDYNRRFIAAFVALVIAISCMAVGFGVRTKAEEYSEEDKPIDMFIMVNDELLTVTQKENSEFYKAVFPSALVDGDIAAGLTYQKTDESGNILIESIISNLNESIPMDLTSQNAVFILTFPHFSFNCFFQRRKTCPAGPPNPLKNKSFSPFRRLTSELQNATLFPK